MSWRYKGSPGSGALADVGSHLTYVARVPRRGHRGRQRRPPQHRDRPSARCRLAPSWAMAKPRSATPSKRSRTTTTPASPPTSSARVGVFEVSRVAAGHANSLALRGLRRERRRQVRPATARRRSSCILNEGPRPRVGYRQVILGPDHPYFAGGLAMDAPGVGFGQNDAFGYQARAFLEEVAGLDEADSLPRCATFDEGVHNMEILAAVAESAANRGTQEVAPQRRSHAMKLGVYNAILHDRSLPEAIEVIAKLGLTGIEINSGGFLPPVHVPTFDDILASDAARDDYLGFSRAPAWRLPA